MAGAKKKVSVKKPQAIAIHGRKGDGSAHVVVGIGDLRVLITNDDGSWFAQGLEIDYAAEGSTLEEAKSHFEEGLVATIGEHLTVYGTIEHLLQPAPKESWLELIKAAKMSKRYTQISVHTQELPELPFESISYFESHGGANIAHTASPSD